VVAYYVRAVVAMSAANGLAQHAREVMKTCCQVAKRVRLAREPDGYAATLSRHGEAGSVTNPPTGWHVRQRQKGIEAAALLVPPSLGETGQR
jgi:hypothetical protein